MKKIICIITFFLTLTVSNIIYANHVSFTDIEGHWAKEYIIKLAENNIINGYADNTFRPNEKVTTAEFLKMIIESGNYKLIRKGNTVWPDAYIETAKTYNLINEQYNNNYNGAITRYQAVEIVSKFIDLKEVKENRNIFKDINDEYKSDILKLVNLKVINGYSDKTFKGNNNITRAEAVKIIDKAVQNRRKINSESKYDITQRTDLSNYGAELFEGEYSKTRYEIKDNELMIFDDGRYSNNWGYIINNQIIDTRKVIKIIKKLVEEDSYTLVTYIPSKYTINQLKIIYGESEDDISYGGINFSLTYFEDKFYELSRISMYEEFSNECYLKIEVVKLWEEYSDYLNGKFVDEYKKQKLLNALKIEFDSEANRILNYIIKKYELYVSNIDRDKEHVEKKTFGKYVINFYQKEYGRPEFYISKKKSFN